MKTKLQVSRSNLDGNQRKTTRKLNHHQKKMKRNETFAVVFPRDPNLHQFQFDTKSTFDEFSLGKFANFHETGKRSSLATLWLFFIRQLVRPASAHQSLIESICD
jgi:hypothetical protein